MALHTLMFGWEYPPTHLGGLGVACQGLVKGLLKRGTRVTLALPYSNSEEKEATVLHPGDIPLQSIRICSLLQPYDTAEAFAERLTGTATGEIREVYGEHLGQAIEQFTAAAVDMTRHTDPDVVHCHDWMTYEAGMRASHHHDRPFVAHIHATELDRTHHQPNEWIYQRERRGFEQAHHIIAVSNYTRNLLRDHYGIHPDKISVVHNGSHDYANTLPHRCRTERPLILFLGRLTTQKGAHQFLDMAAEVKRYRPDAEFIIAGSGDLEAELIERSCRMGLGDCVTFAGKVSQEEARTLYRNASCFVMPSLSEPFGLVALEAASHGTPLILSKQSGASEVLDHVFKVDFWDTAKMADCVCTILRDEALAHQMRTESLSSLRRLSWENQAGAVQSVYERVLTNPSPPRFTTHA